MALIMYLRASLSLTLNLVLFLSFGAQNSSAETFRVLLPAVPKKLDHNDFLINYNFFILNQLFEPLFYLTGDGYKSRILSHWSSDIDGQKYNFCHQKGIYFSNGKEVDIKNFEKSLSSLLKKMGKKYKIFKANDTCIKISFSKMFPDFIKRLTLFDNVLVLDDEKGKYGISQYKLSSFTPGEEIILASSENIRFNKVIVRKKFDEKKVKPLDIHEYNFVAYDHIPNMVKDKFRKFSFFLVESTYLLINISDPQVRSIIYNCVNRELVHEIIYGKEYSLKHMKSFFPVGVFESLNLEILQKCPAKKLGRKKEIGIYYFENNSNGEKLVEYINHTLNPYGISARLQKIGLNQFVNVLQSKEKKYDIAIIAHGGKSVNQYLSSFLDPDFRFRVIKKNVLAEKQFKIYDKKQKLEALVDSKFVLPLVQVKKFFYYPESLIMPKVGNERDINNYKIYEVK